MNEKILSSKMIRQLDKDLAFHFSEALERPYARPQWVFISLSHKCTYACKMCEVVKILKNHELATPAVKSCIDTIAGWKNECVVTITGGEAFLRKDLFEIFDYAVKKQVTIEVVSNGACIDQTTADKTIRSGISNIAISLDGAQAQTHDAIRQPGSFQKAINALKYLAQAKKAYGRGPQISVWTTIMKKNANELFDIIKLVRDLGVECLVYHPVIVSQDDMQNTSSASPFWINDAQAMQVLKEQIDKIKEYRQKNGLVAFLHDPYLWLNYFQGSLTKKNWKCNPFVFINIGPDGQVRSCGAAFGDISENGLDGCLQTKDADEARKMMKACTKPCLQTCWGHPRSDHLETIMNNFIAGIRQADMPSDDKGELISRALKELDRYEAMTKSICEKTQ